MHIILDCRNFTLSFSTFLLCNISFLFCSQPLSKDSHNEKQPPPQTCASVSPTPAEPIQSGSVRADMKAGKNETEVGAIPTVSRKSSENTERKRSVVPAEKQTTPVPHTSTMSVTDLGKPEDNDAELPQINEDFFRALTTALREHRLRQGEKKTSEEVRLALNHGI